MTLRSWDSNAANWTRAVREGRIASRIAATDEAIVQAILRRRPRRLLDVGCGEGWLVRRIGGQAGCTAVGIDGSAALVEAAEGADPSGRYWLLTYDQLIAGERPMGASFDVIAFNFALFDEATAALLAAVRPLMTPEGALIIQTLHPASAPGGADGHDGWRCEDFAAFEDEGWAPMPWYFRTLESWHAVVCQAGLRLLELTEPAAAPGESPLSLLLTCGSAER
ncbi:MAG: class I SAM-dependent methyltransferase [Kiloniellales bacterium]